MKKSAKLRSLADAIEDLEKFDNWFKRVGEADENTVKGFHVEWATGIQVDGYEIVRREMHGEFLKLWTQVKESARANLVARVEAAQAVVDEETQARLSSVMKESAKI